MKFYAVFPLVLFCVVCPSTGFSATSPKPAFDLLKSFQSLFGKPTPKKPSPQNERRDFLITTLLSECSQPGVTRDRVEELMLELGTLSPTQRTASSPLLQNKWLLVWTTEKEINFFLDWKLADEITQTIDGTLLENNIPFVRGGSFGVKGELSIPNVDGVRTDFTFTTATLDLGSWGSFNFPPIGKGWFDTIYLDEDLRVDTNSRNDILICVPSPF
jgi:hypothetical protein